MQVYNLQRLRGQTAAQSTSEMPQPPQKHSLGA